MLRWIDRSQFLSKLIERLSTLMAKRRGLPIVVGIVLVGFSFVLQVLDVYSASQTLQLAGVVTHHVGLLLAMIGLLLADPLGG